ncbi:hypothetical protein [Stenotrophomonas lactitubi]|uniref:hypothetical protein n=1 Tax=Stenotrophomonas lactitubi TaxID=2045214 RepID=UPI0032097559
MLIASGVWSLVNSLPGPPIIAGAAATALMWFRSDGPRDATRLGTVASLVLFGMAMWSSVRASLECSLGLPLSHSMVVVLALVVASVAWRLRAVLRIARRLQSRVEATAMELRWSRLPAAVAALVAQSLSNGGQLDPQLRRVLQLATLTWAANDEANSIEAKQ